MSTETQSAGGAPLTGPWWTGMNRYHWFVLIVASLAWTFDVLDQHLFTLARKSAVASLLVLPESDPQVKHWGGLVTSIFMIGWATGGLFFGVLGDRWGRAKTMVVTVLAYSVFTGLSALSVNIYDFAFYRFLTGLGVGGEFAVGAALVAETMPDRARPRALAMLQAFSALGTISASLIWNILGQLQSAGKLESLGLSPWRAMFLVGAAPALLAVFLIGRLKEPERWRQARAAGGSKEKAGSYRELFGHPVWRKNAILGFILALSGIVGLWGIGFFSPDFSRAVFRPGIEAKVVERHREATAATESSTEDRAALDVQIKNEIDGELNSLSSNLFLMQTFGSVLGIYSFGYFVERFGRKPSFACAFFAAFVSTAAVFWSMETVTDAYWMLPVMGFCQLSLFSGYAIYFAELFPTRLRSTGTSFCYNVGRYVAAFGPFTFGMLTSTVFAGYPDPLPYRYAGICMSTIFILGLLVIPFLPETKGKPLPE